MDDSTTSVDSEVYGNDTVKGNFHKYYQLIIQLILIVLPINIPEI